MDTEKKKPGRPPKVEGKNMLVMVPNVWANQCKFYHGDVVPADALKDGEMEFLIERKQARATADEPTVFVSRDVRPWQRIEIAEA